MNCFFPAQIFFETEIGQRSHTYKMQDMHVNSNEGIVFQTSSLVGPRW